MNKQNLMVFLLFCFSLSSAELPKELSQASCGYIVYDLQENKILEAHNENKFFIPASLTKLFTASQALKQFPWFQQFRTSLYYQGGVVNETLQGNLILEGEGDPLFEDTDLNYMARAAKTLGIKAVKGKILIRNKTYHHPHFETGDLYEAYATEISLLNLNHNMKTIDLVLDEDKFISYDPMVEVKVRKDDTLEPSLRVSSTPFDEKVVIEGNLNESTSFAFAARPLNKYIQDQFIKHLDQVGISVLGEEVDNQEDMFLTARYSERLSTLVSLMLKNSDNLIAETLALHFPNKPYLKLLDGSGMSRHNKLTCLETLELFKNDKDLLEPYLGVAGLDGTLKTRFKDTFLEKRLFAKTGGMEGVCNLAGYWINHEGHPIVVVFMINNSPLPWTDTKKLVDNYLIDMLKRYD